MAHVVGAGGRRSRQAGTSTLACTPKRVSALQAHRRWALTHFQCPNPATSTDIFRHLGLASSLNEETDSALQAKNWPEQRVQAPRIAPRRSGVRVPLAPSRE